MEISGFNAYKCNSIGLTGGMDQSWEVIRYKNNKAIDSVGGIGAVMVQSWQSDRVLDPRIEVIDNLFIGESVLEDCPQDGDGGYCYDKSKQAYSAMMVSAAGNDVHPTMVPSMPYYEPMGSGHWEGYISVSNNEFRHFASTTRTGKRNTMIKNHPLPDHQQIQYFSNNKFVNCDQSNFAHISAPKAGWAGISDCGNFPCTAPLNVLWEFSSNTFEGGNKVQEFEMTGDFQIIANNPGFAPFAQNCVQMSAWNAYICRNDKFAQIVFQSLDSDKMDRSMQPIYIQKAGTGMNNKMNAFMDHCWDGFYTCQKRLQRFVGIMETGAGTVTTLEYTGTPPKSQKFTLEKKGELVLGSTVRIHFPSTAARQLVKGG